MDVCRALACSLPVEVRQEVGAGNDSKKDSSRWHFFNFLLTTIYHNETMVLKKTGGFFNSFGGQNFPAFRSSSTKYYEKDFRKF